jgi:fumarate reductase flavoprotein subunit
MNAVTFDSVGEWNAQVPLLIVGAGAAGICAALAAKESGVDAVVIERDSVPSGSTALSAGLIPAADTRFQRAKGIADSPERFAADIQAKAHDEAPPVVVEAVARGSAPLIEWLTGRHALPFELVENFNYPGHSALRMHGLPSRTGRELIDRLRNAAELSEIVTLTGSTADQLFVKSDGRVRGVEIVRSDGTRERIGCEALILACNGYGGNSELVRRFIPEMADALYFGHSGNRGDAVLWGEALAAELACLGAYQGHGSVATPHNTLITWAVIMEGGIQINAQGQRFGNETRGYSEQAAQVLRQPGGIAWDVFDARIAAVARQFEDFQIAERIGAILMAESVDELAANMRIPTELFAEEWRHVETLKKRGELDRYERRFFVEQHLMPPFCAVKVSGALFHTQGGSWSMPPVA